MGSDLKSCLMWETERPNYHYYSSNRPPLCSSYFRLFGKEWQLKLTLYNNQYTVHLCSRNGKKITEMGTSATCHVATGSCTLFTSDSVSIRDSEQIILEFHMTSNDYSCTSPKWIICCRITCDKPLSLQINNKTNVISIGTTPATSSRSVQTCAETPFTDLQRLSDDFSRLLDKEIIPDATLMCGGQTWRVHQSVLTTRSEVFAAMFRSGMAESETGAVRVQDLEATILNSLLKYIYCGKVRDVSDENVSSLYEAADKYALLGLRKACSDWMVEILSHDNCLDFLVVADAHCDAQLKETVVTFVTQHFAQIEKAIWSNFCKEHSLLAIEVLQRFAPSMKR